MKTHPDLPVSNADRRRHERTVWRRSFAVALLLHVAVFLLWRTDLPLLSPFAAAGPRAGDDQAAAGSMQAMNLSVPPRVPIVPPPVPLPTLEPIEPVEFDEDIEVEASGVAGIDPGELVGPGREDGTGLGDGGNADEGLFRMVPPHPRGMIMPPAHDALKGRDVEVWVFVDASGRVVPDSTRLRPPTGNRSLNQRLIAEAAEWIFEPARQGGSAVAAWFPYRISR